MAVWIQRRPYGKRDMALFFRELYENTTGAVPDTGDPNMKQNGKRQPDSKAHPNDGARLQLIRRRHRKTQKEFAAEFRVSEGTVANYEKARTEMPPSFWRAVNEKYGLNPTPLDPDEDPRLLLQSPWKPRKVSKFETAKSLSLWLAQLRARAKAQREETCSPARLAVEDAMNAIFFLATVVFCAERVRRFMAFELEVPGISLDVVFVSAFGVMFTLTIPVLLSLPWGVTASIDDR